MATVTIPQLTPFSGTPQTSDLLIIHDGSNAKKITFGNLITYNLITVTGNYSVLSSDEIIMVSATTSPTITLPSPSSVLGREFTIKDAAGNASTSNITLDGNGGTIDGSATQTITASYTSVSVFTDGLNWYIK